MSRVLLVEDSKFFGELVRKEIKAKLGLEVTWAKTYSYAKKLLKSRNPDFFVGLLDLNLPDAPMGEIVDLVLSKKIPSIVFTGELDEDLRGHFWSKRIIDYVFKQGYHDINYIVSLVNRIYLNR